MLDPIALNNAWRRYCHAQRALCAPGSAADTHWLGEITAALRALSALAPRT